jgi:hypothetical protein
VAIPVSVAMAPRPATIIALSVQELILKELVLYEFVMVPTKCCINFFDGLWRLRCLENEKFQQAVAAALFRIHQLLGRAEGEGVAAVSCWWYEACL